MIDRRSLLIGIAASTAAATLPASAALPVTTRRETELFARYVWAYDAYNDARRSGDYSAFAEGTANRAALARLWIDIREVANPTSGERHLRDPMEILWFEITRPSWDNF